MKAMIMFTLVDANLHGDMKSKCQELRVPFQDLLGPLVSRLSGEFVFVCVCVCMCVWGSGGVSV